MKNFYWGGTGLLLLQGIRHLLKSKNNRSRTLFSFALSLSFLLFSNLASAQEPRKDSGADGLPKIESLQVGDKVPEYIWHLPINVGNHPEGRSTVTLNDYRGKLILIDFWATWCKACIEGFPKLERIKERFGDDIEILLVNCQQTKDSLENVKLFFEKYKANFSYMPKLPYVVSDTVFQQLFPHFAIPQHAWINSEGNYIASTSASDADFDMLSALIKGDRSGVEQFVDYDRLSVEPKLYVDTTDVFKASALLRYDRSPYSLKTRFTVGEFSVRQAVDKTLFSLIQVAFNKEFKGIPRTQWYIEEELSDEIKNQIKSPGKSDDRYIFQLVQRTSGKPIDLPSQLKSDIQQLFNLNVEQKNGALDVYVVRATPEIDQKKSSGGVSESQMDKRLGTVFFKNVDLANVLGAFNRHLSLPMVQDSIPSLRVDFVLPKAIEDMNEDEIISYLRANGLDVVETRRVIDYLLFKPFREEKP